MFTGIGHAQRVGKDSAATALCRDLGFRRVGFADKLKQLALKADPLVTPATRTVNVSIGHGHLGWVVKGMGWEDAKDQVPPVRLFLQKLGTGARELFGEDFWVDQALRGLDPTDNIVFPDVRFPNEADAIRAHGGRVIRINRPGHEPRGHESEVALAGYEFDWEVHNNGTLVDLEREVVDLVRSWMREDLSEAAASGLHPELEGL